jgi:hypothetical protein
MAQSCQFWAHIARSIDDLAKISIYLSQITNFTLILWPKLGINCSTSNNYTSSMHDFFFNLNDVKFLHIRVKLTKIFLSLLFSFFYSQNLVWKKTGSWLNWAVKNACKSEWHHYWESANQNRIPSTRW